MRHVTIRAAAAEDIPVLAELKATYMRTNYDGFAPADALSRLGSESFLTEFAAWLECPRHHLDVLEADGVIESYIVFQQEDDGTGQILEARTHRPEETADHRELLDRALAEMRRLGCPASEIWLLRSNYRKRFLYESYGFRDTGRRRLEEICGDRFELVQYRYAL